MTTLIYNCPNPQTAFTQKQLTWLANTYQETWYTMEWQPGQPLPFMLIVSDIDREDAESLDLAEEDLVDYHEAIKLLADASEAKMRKDKPQRDIIMPAGLMPAGHTPPQQRNDPMTVTDAIDLTAMLIDNDLCDDCIPEHIKADLRVLQRIIETLQRNYPFSLENENTYIPARKSLCAGKMRIIVFDMMAINQDVTEGKFHNARSEAEPKEEANP